MFASLFTKKKIFIWKRILYVLVSHVALKKIIRTLRSTDINVLSIKIAICALFIVLSMFFWWPGIYVCAGIVCLLILIEFDAKSIVYIFFFASFELLFKHLMFTAICISYMTICLVHFLKQPKQEKKKYIALGIVALVFLIYCALISIGNIGKRYNLLARGFILLFMCCFVKEKISFRLAAYFFIAGILTASLIGLFVDFIPELAARDTKYIVGNMTRFSALTFNPNRLSAHVCLAIPALLIIELRKQIPLKLFIPLFMIMLGIGFATISRTFLVVFAVSFMLYVGLKMKQQKKFSIKTFSIILSIVIIACLCAAPFIIKGFERFSESGLGSGRVALWIDNLKDWLSSPKTFFFGRGVYIDGTHPHNLFIFLLARTGLVGFLLFGALVFILIFTFIKDKENKFCMVSLILPLAFVCLSMFELTMGSAKEVVNMYIFLFLILYILSFEKRTNNTITTRTEKN